MGAARYTIGLHLKQVEYMAHPFSPLIIVSPQIVHFFIFSPSVFISLSALYHKIQKLSRKIFIIFHFLILCFSSDAARGIIHFEK